MTFSQIKPSDRDKRKRQSLESLFSSSSSAMPRSISDRIQVFDAFLRGSIPFTCKHGNRLSVVSMALIEEDRAFWTPEADQLPFKLVFGVLLCVHYIYKNGFGFGPNL